MGKKNALDSIQLIFRLNLRAQSNWILETSYVLLHKENLLDIFTYFNKISFQKPEVGCTVTWKSILTPYASAPNLVLVKTKDTAK